MDFGPPINIEELLNPLSEPERPNSQPTLPNGPTVTKTGHAKCHRNHTKSYNQHEPEEIRARPAQKEEREHHINTETRRKKTKINKLRIVSMNIQSAMKVECFSDVEGYLNEQEMMNNPVHILCLQETWFGEGVEFKQLLKYSQILNNKYKMVTDHEGLEFTTYRGTGAAIIYSEDVAIYMQGIKDQPKKQGAIATVRVSTTKHKIIIGSVYIPSVQGRKREVYAKIKKLKEEIAINEPETKLILIGDWNDKMDPLLDRDHGTNEDTIEYSIISRKPTNRQLERLTSKLDSMEPLVDIYRELHPNSKEYTHNAGSGAQARLDFSLISENTRPTITSAVISPHPINIRYHHNPIEIGMDLNINNLKRREIKVKQRNNKL
jgi:exonuclease III